MPTAPALPNDRRADDTALVERITRGDAAAFEQLMRRHNRQLYRTARSIVQRDDEAEDVLQEAYLLAFRNLDGFRGASSLSTWLTRIVINEALGRQRKDAHRAQLIPIVDTVAWDEAGHEDAVHTGAVHTGAVHTDLVHAAGGRAAPEQPDQAIQRTQLRRLIERKIDALPEAYRTVFMLRALEEMSVEETALCLAIPEATVRTRFFRARGMLREALAREIDLGMDDAFGFDGARCDRIVAALLAALPAYPTPLHNPNEEASP